MADPRPPLITFLMGERGACAWYRCMTPAAALAQVGYAVEVTDEVNPPLLQASDVVMAQRVAHPVLTEIVDFVRQSGGRFVYDLDDDIWNIDPSSPANEFWSRGNHRDLVAQLARKADLVTAPTQALLGKLAQFNKSARLIPNYLPDEHWPVSGRRPGDGSRIVIGWAGSSTHAPDFAIVRDSLMAILERYDHVEVHLAGASSSWMPSHERVRHLDLVPIAEYASLLSGFDIGLAPLVSNKFNECKSDLKALEYSMTGIPVVASKTGPYAAFIEHGVSGMLASNTKDWLRALTRLIEEPVLRESMMVAARASAEKRFMSRNVARYEKAYGLVRPADDSNSGASR